MIIYTNIEGEIKNLSLPFDFDAYLVEAVKEQQRQMEVLKNEKNSEIKELKIRIENLEKK